MHTIFIQVFYWIGAVLIKSRYCTGSIYKFSYFYLHQILQPTANSVFRKKIEKKRNKEKKIDWQGNQSAHHRAGSMRTR
jgi:hypothetical protein